MTLKQISFYPKLHHEELKKVTCQVIHNQVHVGLKGLLTLCCPTWMPWYVGNINETTINEYLKSSDHQKIIASMLDGSLSYCDHAVCPEIQSYLRLGKSKSIVLKEDYYEDKRMVLLLDYDQSCNLQCPSCRNKLIFHKDYPADILSTHQRVLESLTELLDSGREVCLSITGSGDAFASKLYADMIKNFSHPSQNFTFGIETNGILMTSKVLDWVNMRDHVAFFNISIDAASPEVYSIVRRGGNFDRLKTNLGELNQRLRKGYFKLNPTFKTNFIVSATNFREAAKYAMWQIEEYDQLTNVWFNCIADWFHLGPQKFNELAVWKEDHPDHQDFLEVLKDPIFKHPKVKLGNLSKFIRS